MSMTNQISRDELRSAIEDKLCAHYGVTALDATDEQVFQASAIVIREIMSRVLTFDSSVQPEREVHYLSMEFLMGRSLMKNAFNLGVAEALEGALNDMGRSAADIFETEPDAGLGNGGLGRLAACYMDSLATQDIPATGYSLCYELGIFRQKIENGRQTEVADNWRTAAEGWLVPRYEDTVEVRFGGHVEAQWDNYGHYHGELKGYESVLAVPRDMLVAGYGNTRVNTLRLWEAHSPNDLDMYLFATGDYVKSMEQRTMAEVITKVLYPADDHIQGKTLRIRQQYFFVSATAQSIVRDHRARYGTVRNFPEHHVIQINDTHPTLMIPELMRLFMDEDGLGWDEAWDIVTACVNYTNHTVMSEALETWPQGLIQSQMPRVWEIICEINRRWCEYLRGRFGDDARVGRNLILADGKVHMANLCLAACKTVNGVSGLHGDILKNDLFRDVCALSPERFTYVTNGIDHRRWLAQINPGLHRLVCDLLGGDGYLLHPEELCKLNDFTSDPAVLARVEAIKRENKLRFAQYTAREGFTLDTDAILDVQVKRLHEYKRQLLCAMLITALQQRLHDDPNQDFVPRTFVFGAKAAPGYATAKRIIQLLCSLAADVNADPVCKGRLQVHFLENYRVSVAEVLMPAVQVSEQISTAGKEASGTGNMKMMMNGAVTIGTLDGANVEMYERLGDRNMFLFGLHADEADALRARGYNPLDCVRNNDTLRRVLERMNRGYADGESYSDLAGQLLYGGDPYLLLADFKSYVNCHDRLYATISDPAERARLSLVNTAESGVFAADRAVLEYAQRIWRVK
ncbi:MAG: glycogen/starch/alpha-glucan phosphorylase [Oscillospiraceae bacterium]|nr:glycogen/starch/alpha-glucan family phosphorylase [Clostridiales bacterium]MDD6107916.1 glycogen/starch/alpha-glucan phosphorylase [Clostridiales bacterium]MDD6936864.1 glycogen/starch/alpha-glucan phosphorylase [Clostridiales bacterium]MDY2961228.1 glycogen/starch/alpha-glucan phosphorylase [Oscillospiraceae bacterium]MDY5595473.1 glycogen/starch/alpha-glucan phosphorylase [Oscillospiraceae bacterium]